MTPLDETTAAHLLAWFARREEEMLDFLKVVPPQGANLDAWSPVLATIIVDACGMIDSLYRHVSPETVTLPSSGREKARENLELPHYAELYGEPRQLADRKVIVLTEPPAYRTPFAGWSRTSDAPEWWATHNRLKHHRLEHLRRATTAAALDALGGALLAMVTAPELARALIRHGWLHIGGRVVEAAIEIAEGEFHRQHDDMTVDTQLFALPLGPVALPAEIEDFHPQRYGGSRRLSLFFGRRW